MIKILMAAAVTLLMSSSFARAQVVIQADSAMLQPQIKRDALGFSSCGVRGIVISVAGKNFESYDFSVVANAVAPFGTLKAGKSLTTVERVNKGDLSGTVVTPRPEYFWIAQESSGDALMPLKVFPAENQGFILEIGDLIKTYKVIYAMIHGERMHFVLRYKKQKLDYVISFAASLSEQEKTPLMACLKSVSERIISEQSAEQ